MASRGRVGFWGIIALLIILVGVLIGGSLVGLPNGGQCTSPDGCQCGIATSCGQWQSCTRFGPFGKCN